LIAYIETKQKQYEKSNPKFAKYLKKLEKEKNQLSFFDDLEENLQVIPEDEIYPLIETFLKDP
jgi:hypothetical protein